MADEVEEEVILGDADDLGTGTFRSTGFHLSDTEFPDVPTPGLPFSSKTPARSQRGQLCISPSLSPPGLLSVPARDSDSTQSLSKEPLITALDAQKKAGKNVQFCVLLPAQALGLPWVQDLTEVTSGPRVWYRDRCEMRLARDTGLWVSSRREHLYLPRSGKPPKGRDSHGHGEGNVGWRQRPARGSQIYLDLSPCCVTWEKLLNLSEPRL